MSSPKKSPCPGSGLPPTGARDGRHILSEARWYAIGDFLHLSRRELEIVHCLFDDLAEAAIARELSISPHTVHTHLERLYRKLGVTSRCGAILRVFAEHVSLDCLNGQNTSPLPPA